jgi:hypothetical protein
MKIIRHRLAKVFGLIVLFSGAISVSTEATNYYISSKNGNDNNVGTSSGAPWKTIGKLNQVLPSLRAGDVVYFERGSEWDNVSL